jgi:TPR repeat protein
MDRTQLSINDTRKRRGCAPRCCVQRNRFNVEVESATPYNAVTMRFLKRLFGSSNSGGAEFQFNKFRKAAEQGNAPAQYELGSCYGCGYGVESDQHEAFKWYHKAAEQRLAVAAYHVGLSYHRGCGVQKNLEEAARWYTRSATAGGLHAKYALEQIVRANKGEGPKYGGMN